MNQNMTVSKLAEKSGVNRETIRYYEKRGLLPLPKRSPSGYRVYSKEAIKQITFIKSAQLVGFTLKEIQELLDLSLRKGENSSGLHRMVSGKIELINEKIRELNRFKKSLKEFNSLCEGDHNLEDCHLVHSLWGVEELCDES